MAEILAKKVAQRNQTAGVALGHGVWYSLPMADLPDQDQYSPEETERRVQRALTGAFKGAPTPLKAVRRKPRASRVKTAICKARKSA